MDSAPVRSLRLCYPWPRLHWLPPALRLLAQRQWPVASACRWPLVATGAFGAGSAPTVTYSFGQRRQPPPRRGTETTFPGDLGREAEERTVPQGRRTDSNVVSVQAPLHDATGPTCGGKLLTPDGSMRLGCSVAKSHVPNRTPVQGMLQFLLRLTTY